MNANDKSILSFAMVGHAMVHTYELSIPILMTIWLSEFSVSAATLGLVVSVGYGLFGLGALPGGVLVDAYGSRRLVVLGLVGMGASFLVLSTAPNVYVVGLAIAAWGVAASVYHPAGLSLISKGVEHRGSGFAYHGMAGNLGIALGPLATAVLLLFFEWRFVTALLAVPAAVGAAFGLVSEFDETAALRAADGGTDTDVASETASRGSAGVVSVREFLDQSRSLFAAGFGAVFVVVMMNGLFYRGTLTFLPDLLERFLTPLVGDPTPAALGESAAANFEPSRYLYAGLLMVGVAGQYVGGRLTDRWRLESTLAAAFGALIVIALLFVPAANAGVVALVAISALLGFTLFTLQPLYQATIAEYTPADVRGLSYGFTYLGVFGIGAAGAAIAGALVTYVEPTSVFAALAVFPAIAAAVCVRLALSDGRR